MATIYFWKDKQVYVYEGDNYADTIRESVFYRCFAVDTSDKGADMRYGVYLDTGWKHIPLEKFPKAFRTNLLLLGIS